MTLSQLRGSLSSSSSGSSCTSSPDMPMLVWLSSLVSAAEGRSPRRVLEYSETCVGSSSRLFCRVSPLAPDTILPPLMLPSSVFSMSLSSGLLPSTMTPPLRFFQLLATSSRTFSARPSSRHPEPQCRPMKVASSCRAEDVSVRLCFLVKVRKASGRRVAGGSRMGRMAAFAGAVTVNGRRGWAGVPKAGDEEGMEESGSCWAARFLGAKKGATGGLVRRDGRSSLSLSSFSGLCCGVFCRVLRGLCTTIMSVFFRLALVVFSAVSLQRYSVAIVCWSSNSSHCFVVSSAPSALLKSQYLIIGRVNGILDRV